MEKISSFGPIIERLAPPRDEPRPFDALDCAMFKTMLMLAAVDGFVSASELNLFHERAMQVSGFGPDEFESLWRTALHLAGYVEIQARLLRKDDLVATFVSEAADVLLPPLFATPRARWTRVFDCLNAIAGADGSFSPVEKACINALVARIRKVPA